MIHLERLLRGFPRGRTLSDLMTAAGCRHDPVRQRDLTRELHRLVEARVVERRQDGRWQVVTRQVEPAAAGASQPGALGAQTPGDIHAHLVAAPARFRRSPSAAAAETEEAASSGMQAPPDPHALLRYYASSLRSDPRGATMQSPDLHGTQFQLVSGSGVWWSDDDETSGIEIALDALPAGFREALDKRAETMPTLAVGWPIAVGRFNGVQALWPVGLMAARWDREAGLLRVQIESRGLLLNPDWLSHAGRALEARIAGAAADQDDRKEIPADVLAERLREAVAGQVRGRLAGTSPAATLDPEASGIFDALGLFLPTETTFTAGATRDLETLAKWEREQLAATALAPVLGLGEGATAEGRAPVNTGPINAEQIAATDAALSAPLTVVTGPPGTGKSQAIVAMVASALLRGQRVLVASRNHQALDAVETRLTGLAPGTRFHVRTLNPQQIEANGRPLDVSLRDVLKALSGDASPPARPPAPEDLSALEDLAERRRRASRAATERRRLQVRIAELVERRRSRVTAQQETEGPAASAEPEGRAAAGWWRRLFRFLVGARAAPETLLPLPETPPAGADAATLEACIARDREALAALPVPEDPVALTERITKLAQRVFPRAVAVRAAIDEETRRGFAELDAQLLLEDRKMPREADADRIVACRPLWLTSVLGTPKRLPLVPGLFDLVIFDEASQCDIASALPLMARARRAVVVGDDRQLGFIPRVGVAQERNLMAAQGLPLCGMAKFAQGMQSLFSLARATPGARAVMLAEQYRSAPEIVEYLNEAFYGRRLRAAVDEDGLKVPNGQRPGLAWTHVRGRPDAGSAGENANPAEAAAIAAHLAELARQRYDGSVGIISPFRRQVLLLTRALADALSADAQARLDLRIATVDAFQSMERDLILFSPTVFDGSPASGHTFLSKDWRRLNVAISRGRAVAHVFGDLDFARSNRIRSLAMLAARATEPRTRRAEGVFDSDWERILDAAMRARGLDPRPQYPVAGRRLDFALFRGSTKLDVEVDGRQFHQDIDGNRKADDLWRDHQLRSLGWKVRRFWVDELDRDLEGCLDLIDHDLA